MIIKPKSILVGSPKVGKTAIYKQVTRGEFIPDYLPSITIDPGFRLLEISPAAKAKLQVMDTPGTQNAQNDALM